MNAEQLRHLAVRAADKLLESRVARWSMSVEEVRLLRAMRTFWHRADASDLHELLAYFDAQPLYQHEAAPDLLSGQYRCGHVESSSATLYPLTESQWNLVQLIGVNVPQALVAGQFYRLAVEQFEPQTGFWLVYGKEPGDDEVSLLYKFACATNTRQQVETDAAELENRGVTDVRIDYTP